MNKKNIFIHGCKNINQLKKTVASLGADHNIYVIGDFDVPGTQKLTGKNVLCAINDIVEHSKENFLIVAAGIQLMPSEIERLEACAYAEEHIASATPLNGDRDLLIPLEYQKLAMPRDMIAQKYYLGENKKAIAGGAWCVFIKRSIFLENGGFNIEHFTTIASGLYSFYFETVRQGKIHAICCNVMAGIAGDKVEVDNSEQQKVAEYYPHENYQMGMMPLHENIQKQREALVSLACLENGKKNVLFVLHVDFKDGTDCPIGGTQFHVRDIVLGIPEINSFVLACNNGRMYLTAYIDGMIRLEMEYFLGAAARPAMITDDNYQRTYEEIFDIFHFDIVHIHHLKNHTFDLLDSIYKRNIPTIYSAHDYYVICPTLNLIDAEEMYCQGKYEQSKCNACLKKRLDMSGFSLETWQKRTQRMLEYCKSIVTPSKSVANILVEHFDVKDKIVVIPHGSPQYKRVSIPTYDLSVFRVAFLGGIAKHKGSDLIYDVIVHNHDKRIQWYSMGTVQDNRFMELVTRDDVINLGQYQSENVYDLLETNQINLVCILSVCPETFCFTLSEAWQCNIPVVVTDIGALGTRVAENGAGIAVPLDNAIDGVLKAIEKIAGDPQVYETYCMEAKKVRGLTIEEMIGQYRKLLMNSVENEQIEYPVKNICAAYPDIYEQYQKMQIRNLEKTVNSLGYELDQIKRSNYYGLMMKYKNMKIPGKKLVSKILHRLRKKR